MIFALLESPLVDVLLIAAALYYVFPGLFRRSIKQPNDQRRNITVITQDKHKGSGKYDGEGEYVDYEEVK